MKTLHSNLVGRFAKVDCPNVKVNPDINDPDGAIRFTLLPPMGQFHFGKTGEIVNAYMRDGSPMVDLLQDDGVIIPRLPSEWLTYSSRSG